MKRGRRVGVTRGQTERRNVWIAWADVGSAEHASVYQSSPFVVANDPIDPTMEADAPLVGRWQDLEKLLTRPGNLVGPDFEPGPELLEFLQSDSCRILCIGAGGLGRWREQTHQHQAWRNKAADPVRMRSMSLDTLCRIVDGLINATIQSRMYLYFPANVALRRV